MACHHDERYKKIHWAANAQGKKRPAFYCTTCDAFNGFLVEEDAIEWMALYFNNRKALGGWRPKHQPPIPQAPTAAKTSSLVCYVGLQGWPSKPNTQIHIVIFRRELTVEEYREMTKAISKLYKKSEMTYEGWRQVVGGKSTVRFSSPTSPRKAKVEAILNQYDAMLGMR